MRAEKIICPSFIKKIFEIHVIFIMRVRAPRNKTDNYFYCNYMCIICDYPCKIKLKTIYNTYREQSIFMLLYFVFHPPYCNPPTTVERLRHWTTWIGDLLHRDFLISKSDILGFSYFVY